MTNDNEYEAILAFMKSHPLAVISTMMPRTNQPESALIAFAGTDSLEIIFETFVDTRKWDNLKANPKVSFVIGWDTEDHRTLQYEGEAYLIEEEKIKYYRSLFLQKDTPCTETFLLDPRVRLFKVKPTWIRYSDYCQEVPKIIEVSWHALDKA